MKLASSLYHDDTLSLRLTSCHGKCNERASGAHRTVVDFLIWVCIPQIHHRVLILSPSETHTRYTDSSDSTRNCTFGYTRAINVSHDKPTRQYTNKETKVNVKDRNRTIQSREVTNFKREIAYPRLLARCLELNYREDCCFITLFSLLRLYFSTIAVSSPKRESVLSINALCCLVYMVIQNHGQVGHKAAEYTDDKTGDKVVKNLDEELDELDGKLDKLDKKRHELDTKLGKLVLDKLNRKQT